MKPVWARIVPEFRCRKGRERFVARVRAVAHAGESGPSSVWEAPDAGPVARRAARIG